jgi:hypothetical protein
VLSLPLTLDEIAAGFEPRAYREGIAVEAAPASDEPLVDAPGESGDLPSDATFISFMGVFRGRGSLLFETHIGEPTIDQRIGLLLMERWRGKAGEYTLQPGTLGHPRMTEGVHTAVKLLADWVLSLNPEGRVLLSKLRGE